MTQPENNHSYTQLPEAMERADIGPYFASLREHYKLSVADVAGHLNMRTKYIEAIEASAFEGLPDPVYARGFVRQYAEFLGIDPQQAVAKVFDAQSKKKEKFFVPEPSRGVSAPMRIWLSVVAVLFCGYAIYDYNNQRDADALHHASMAIPERFMHAARNQPFFIGRDFRCVAGDALADCLVMPSEERFSLVGRGL
jgi:hypothetical protein